ncbi:MAG: hypothetical protein Q9222_000344 [Ikaeria aurantiellina]
MQASTEPLSSSRLGKSTQHRGSSSPLEKLQQLARNPRETTKQLWNTSKQPGELQDSVGVKNGDHPTYLLEKDAAFNTELLHTKHRSRKSLGAKIQVNAEAVMDGVKHPIAGFKGKAARSTASRLSKLQRPYLSQDMDLQYLEAYDDVVQPSFEASSCANSTEAANGPSHDQNKTRLEGLEAQREGFRAAYTTSRFVQRVCRVTSQRRSQLPRIGCHKLKTENGEQFQYDWMEWVGNSLLYLTQDFSGQYTDDLGEKPFDTDYLRLQLERLLMASAPWQC